MIFFGCLDRIIWTLRKQNCMKWCLQAKRGGWYGFEISFLGKQGELFEVNMENCIIAFIVDSLDQTIRNSKRLFLDCKKFIFLRLLDVDRNCLSIERLQKHLLKLMFKVKRWHPSGTTRGHTWEDWLIIGEEGAALIWVHLSIILLS